MFAAVKQSNAALEAKQRNQMVQVHKMLENRKHKAIFTSREQQKRLKLDELMSQTHEQDSRSEVINMKLTGTDCKVISDKTLIVFW